MDIIDKKFHFIAIGGVGMSALAKYLAQRGAVVTGSDIQESKYTHLLEELGVSVSIGHRADLITNDMIVVASSAIKDSNPELKRAKELGLKIYHRSDILKIISDEFAIKKDSVFLGFSGTHGKTTTSGLASYLLSKSGLNPSFVVGGIIPELNTNGEYSSDKYFCAELDESDGTIQKYSTDVALINNMEEDHLDYYKNGFDDIAKTFNKYLSNNPNQKVIINIDDKGNKKFMEMYRNYNFITFGINCGKYNAKNISFLGLGSSFDVYFEERFLDRIELSIPGKHNIYNALGVYASLRESGVDTTLFLPYFKTFSGMGRRFQKVSEVDGIVIYDDYAHHPSEIKTTLSGVKDAIGKSSRLVAIFQPHRYSRLASLWDEFKTAFDSADKLIIIDVFSAGEEQIAGVNSENFYKDIKHKDAIYVSGNIENAAEKIYPFLKKGDIVITLGAGSVTNIGKLLNKQLVR